MNVNYYKMHLEEMGKIKKLKKKPTLLLHACCAPCSSAVLEYLKDYFDITLYFYNPNISPKEEFDLRLKELYELLLKMELKDIKIVSPDYNNMEFENIAKGLEDLEEGKERCKKCYKLRLNSAFKYAKDNNFSCVATTLSVSPYKNATCLNEIGLELEKEYNVKYLISDFKKQNGYKRSCELSSIYNLYRQNYCGCIYSKNKANEEKLKIKAYKDVPYEARMIREEVFLKEQGFKSEYDEIDNIATHLVAYYNKEPVGALRIFTDSKSSFYILGRLSVLKNKRGKGIGSKMVEYALSYVKSIGGSGIKLHSQLRAKEFYEKLGFIAYGDIEYEEDVPHIWMKRRYNMKASTYNLWDFECENENPTITHYAPEVKKSDWSVVIFPGGAYSHRAVHEGKGYAEFLASNGINAFVVEYRVKPSYFPCPLLDARRAIRFVRFNAKNFGISKEKIAAMGSSAGGHLVALLSNYYNELENEPKDDIYKEDYIPDAHILCYPVIFVTGKYAHTGSGQNLLNDDYEKKGEQFNIDKLVTKNTPPAFIWHTYEDDGVSVMNSVKYFEKLKENNVNGELHIFPYGRHGLGLCEHCEVEEYVKKSVTQWKELLINWLNSN